MALLLVFLAALVLLEACPPPTTPFAPSAPTTKSATATTASTTITSASTSNTTNASSRKRSVSQVLVTLVSNQAYDPRMKDSHMQVFNALFDEYVRTKGTAYNKDLVRKSAKNENGMFAIEYNVWGADCDAVTSFVREGKANAGFITAAKIKCEGRSEVVFK